MDHETLRLLGKRAKLDSKSLEELPRLINEDWGSDVLKKAYKDRLKNADKDLKKSQKG